MAGMKRISAGGRALLVVGAILLFGSLFFLPWFVVSGTRPDLPARPRDGHDEIVGPGGGALGVEEARAPEKLAVRRRRHSPSGRR